MKIDLNRRISARAIIACVLIIFGAIVPLHTASASAAQIEDTDSYSPTPTALPAPGSSPQPTFQLNAPTPQQFLSAAGTAASVTENVAKGVQFWNKGWSNLSLNLGGELNYNNNLLNVAEQAGNIAEHAGTIGAGVTLLNTTYTCSNGLSADCGLKLADSVAALAPIAGPQAAFLGTAYSVGSTVGSFCDWSYSKVSDCVQGTSGNSLGGDVYNWLYGGTTSAPKVPFPDCVGNQGSAACQCEQQQGLLPGNPQFNSCVQNMTNAAYSAQFNENLNQEVDQLADAGADQANATQSQMVSNYSSNMAAAAYQQALQTNEISQQVASRANSVSNNALQTAASTPQQMPAAFSTSPTNNKYCFTEGCVQLFGQTNATVTWNNGGQAKVNGTGISGVSSTGQALNYTVGK